MFLRDDILREADDVVNYYATASKWNLILLFFCLHSSGKDDEIILNDIIFFFMFSSREGDRTSNRKN
jgi:hypothetical protein